jgi:ketosteroid isomerase-like protein
MHPNAALVAGFYQAFRRRDAAAMAACYHPAITFSDPVFPALRGAEASAMWAMLCARATDLAIELDEVRANEARGSARWEARYSFGPARRRVHNVVEAAFEFRDGLIVRHVDRFGFWRWARQALGPAGLLVGWTPLLRAQVRARARRSLRAWLAGRAA